MTMSGPRNQCLPELENGFCLVRFNAKTGRNLSEYQKQRCSPYFNVTFAGNLDGDQLTKQWKTDLISCNINISQLDHLENTGGP